MLNKLADIVRELAREYGMDEDTLVDEVRRFYRIADEGDDDSSMGRAVGARVRAGRSEG